VNSNIENSVVMDKVFINMKSNSLIRESLIGPFTTIETDSASKELFDEMKKEKEKLLEIREKYGDYVSPFKFY
ncbi:MAG: hypothetical protein QXU98_12830, partial [Candidatus Parvarchaeota archaeon]